MGNWKVCGNLSEARRGFAGPSRYRNRACGEKKPGERPSTDFLAFTQLNKNKFLFNLGGADTEGQGPAVRPVGKAHGTTAHNGCANDINAVCNLAAIDDHNAIVHRSLQYTVRQPHLH